MLATVYLALCNTCRKNHKKKVEETRRGQVQILQQQMSDATLLQFQTHDSYRKVNLVVYICRNTDLCIFWREG